MTAIDTSSLKFWELVGEWGFIFVWVGVAGEGVEIFIKLFRPKVYERKKFCLDMVGAVFWAVLVLALAVEFMGNHKAMRIADTENARLNKEAADARLKTAQLEFKLQPRILRFNPAAFREALKGKPKLQLEILYPKEDEEAYDFADEIWKALYDEGWNIPEPRPFTEDDSPMRREDGSVINNGMPLSRMVGVSWGNIGFLAKDVGGGGTNAMFWPLANAIGVGLGSGGYAAMHDSRLPGGLIKLIIGPEYPGPNWQFNNGPK